MLCITVQIFGQQPNDTIKKRFFSDKELKQMDSLMVASKFSSGLVDTTQYIINDKDITGNTTTSLSTSLLKKRLNFLNSKTPFNVQYNKTLEDFINSYLYFRKKYYPAVMAKSQYYFPMFEKYLDAYNIPLEMKYLAVVESTLKARAKSRVGARGLWQFMYGTGKEYNLNVNSYVDERLNPEKATIAASKYLSKLYKIFKDWDLALAAYNSGPGNVLKAIKRSGGYRNYWNIRPFLPKETADYVPAFYATLYMFEYAKEHKIFPDVPKFFNFQTDTVIVKQTISFNQIAKKIPVEVETLRELNPEYKLDIIPYVKGKNYALMLPKNLMIDFLDKEKDIYALAKKQYNKKEKPLSKFAKLNNRISYRVVSGDYLGKIANKYGVSVSNLKRWNNLKSSKLSVGQRIYIYGKNSKLTTTKTVQQAQKNKEFTTYIVKNGDSLWKISRKFKNVSVANLKKWNNIWSVKDLKPGTKLKIFKN